MYQISDTPSAFQGNSAKSNSNKISCQLPVQLQCIQLIMAKTNKLQFRISIVEYNQWTISVILFSNCDSELYCLFIAAHSIVDTINIIWYIVV